MHSRPKSKFCKILVENTAIVAHKINKPQLQILEALFIKKTTIELILKIATMFWNAFSLFYFVFCMSYLQNKKLKVFKIFSFSW